MDYLIFFKQTGKIDQIVEQALVKKNSNDPELKSHYGGYFFNREKQLLAMNPGQALNYHAETCSSDIFN